MAVVEETSGLVGPVAEKPWRQECGDGWGSYRRHLRNKEIPCPECRKVVAVLVSRSRLQREELRRSVEDGALSDLLASGRNTNA